VRAMRQCVSSECPSSFARLYGLIFALQTSFDAAIAIGTFLVTFLLLNSTLKWCIESVGAVLCTFSLL
jgi:hypothetical protein